MTVFLSRSLPLLALVWLLFAASPLSARTWDYRARDFQTGEVVVFDDHSYDPKGGVIRFWFRIATSQAVKAWHVWEAEVESLGRWQDFFEHL